MGQLPGSRRWHVPTQAARSQASGWPTTQHLRLARSQQVRGVRSRPRDLLSTRLLHPQSLAGTRGHSLGCTGLQALHAGHAAGEQHPGTAHALTSPYPTEQVGRQGTRDGKVLAVSAAQPSREKGAEGSSGISAACMDCRTSAALPDMRIVAGHVQRGRTCAASPGLGPI